MEESKIPKWQKEVEAILREQFQGDDLLEQLKKAEALASFVQNIEVPSGDMGKVVSIMLRAASEELRPQAAVYAGFQLGVAYERYQNANRTRKP